jgi:CHAT domain-containing protein
MRIQYFDTGRRLFESEVRLLADARDPREALFYADRSHARALLDVLRTIPERSSAEQGPNSDLLLGRDSLSVVPEGTAVVEFLMLPDQLMTWVARRGQVEIVRSPFSEGRISDLVRRLENARADLSSSRTVLGDLHDVLIRPVESLVAGSPHLVIVPDRDLHRVPFSALIDSRTGAYLIASHDITIAPSAATFLHLRDRAPPSDVPPSVLAVAGPPTAPLPGFQRLEHVDEECRRVSSLYPRSLVLSNGRATRSAFRDAVPSFSVIHFAGHAVANSTRPALSMLVLAPDPQAGDNGFLYSHEFSSVDFRGVRLVVLGACSTAAGRSSTSEGVLGLARSVLAAGVPSVVASLWPVDDATTASLMTALHVRLRAGDSTSAALRAAQLRFLQGRETVPTLSPTAFQVYGAPVIVSERRSE